MDEDSYSGVVSDTFRLEALAPAGPKFVGLVTSILRAGIRIENSDPAQFIHTFSLPDVVDVEQNCSICYACDFDRTF